MNHAVCVPCWVLRHPEDASEDDRPGPEETCGYCGEPTNSGIYVHVDPAKGREPDEHLPMREAP